MRVVDEFIVAAREVREGTGMLSDDVDYMAAKVNPAYPRRGLGATAVGGDVLDRTGSVLLVQRVDYCMHHYSHISLDTMQQQYVTRYIQTNQGSILRWANKQTVMDLPPGRAQRRMERSSRE